MFNKQKQAKKQTFLIFLAATLMNIFVLVLIISIIHRHKNPSQIKNKKSTDQHYRSSNGMKKNNNKANKLNMLYVKRFYYKQHATATTEKPLDFHQNNYVLST